MPTTPLKEAPSVPLKETPVVVIVLGPSGPPGGGQTIGMMSCPLPCERTGGAGAGEDGERGAPAVLFVGSDAEEPTGAVAGISEDGAALCAGALTKGLPEDEPPPGGAGSGKEWLSPLGDAERKTAANALANGSSAAALFPEVPAATMIGETPCTAPEPLTSLSP